MKIFKIIITIKDSHVPIKIPSTSAVFFSLQNSSYLFSSDKSPSSFHCMQARRAALTAFSTIASGIVTKAK